MQQPKTAMLQLCGYYYYYCYKLMSLSKVIKADADEDILVRKVTVTYKKKNPRESLSICKSKPMIVEEVATVPSVEWV